MRIFPHEDYEDYKAAQIEKNIRKFNTVWAKDVEIISCCNLLSLNGIVPLIGICHGVRNGWEAMAFRSRLPGCKIIGTDISPTILNVNGCFQHDFHDVRPEWKAIADFVYSNSLDHAYDPRKALTAWMGQLRVGGYLFLGWFEKNGIDKGDCFLASKYEIISLLTEFAGKRPRIVCDSRERYLVFGVQKS